MQVLVVSGGIIAEQGTHSELLTAGVPPNFVETENQKLGQWWPLVRPQ